MMIEFLPADRGGNKRKSFTIYCPDIERFKYNFEYCVECS